MAEVQLMPLPAKRVRIKSKTPRQQKPKPIPKLLFPGIINEKTILSLTSSTETVAKEYYDEKIYPFSCAQEDNFIELKEGIKLFRRLLLRVTSQLKPGDPILPDVGGPDAAQQTDIRIYLPIYPCDLKPIQDDLGYVKLKMKKPSADNDTDVERTDYFRGDLSKDGVYVNTYLVCRKLHRALELGLTKKKVRGRRRKRKRSRTLSGVSEESVDTSRSETTTDDKETVETSAPTREEIITGVLGSGFTLKNGNQSQSPSATKGESNPANKITTEPVMNGIREEPMEDGPARVEGNNAGVQIVIDPPDEPSVSATTQTQTQELPDLPDFNLPLKPDDDACSVISDLDGPKDFSDLDQLTLYIHEPPGYPIVNFRQFKFHIIPIINVKKLDCDFLMAEPYLNDKYADSEIIWRKSYIYRERYIFRSMHMADMGTRLKVFQVLLKLASVDKALSMLNEDIIMSAMLHDFDTRIDDTPRWQRNNLEAGITNVFQTLSDLLVNNTVPHFFMKQLNLLEGYSLLQVARLKGRVRTLATTPAVLLRAFKLQPSISESAWF